MRLLRPFLGMDLDSPHILSEGVLSQYHIRTDKTNYCLAHYMGTTDIILQWTPTKTKLQGALGQLNNMGNQVLKIMNDLEQRVPSEGVQRE
jgi:hypothetical protein